jgi:transposase
VEVVRGKFAITEVVMVGDRGMITSARIKALKELPGMAWITCLRAPAIRKLADGGPLQLSLFDRQDLAEISSPAYPGERLIACHNPVLAQERAAHRERLLAATEAELTKIEAMVTAGRLSDPTKLGIRVGKVINKRKVAKHFLLDIGQASVSWRRDQASIDAEAALDGIYVIRTPLAAAQLDAPAVVAAYKDLSNVEQDFKLSKDDLDLRPIWHRLQDRVRAHVLVCMLACYLAWHLRKAWAPLTYADEHPPARDNPVAPAHRSPAAEAKAARKVTATGEPARGFRQLLDHLATLTRQTIVIGGHQIEKLTTPTQAQGQAFSLLGAPVPITLE